MEVDSIQPLPLARNPFLISVILKRFFELCEPNDLPRFRLVCKLWHSESLATYLKERTVEISRTTWRQSFTLWKDFTDQMTSGKKSFRSLRLRNFVTFKFIPDLKVEDFWTICGPRIRKLELISCTISDVDSFNKLLLDGCPCLKELHLISFQSTSTWDSSPLEQLNIGQVAHSHLRHLRIKFPFSFPATWRSLLLYFPNLQTLTFENLEFCSDAKGRNILNELGLICGVFEMHKPTFSIVFKNLKFRLRFTEKHRPHDGNTAESLLKVFRVLQPKLENVIRLELEIGSWRDEEMSLLSEILQLAGGGALKEFILKVDRECGSNLNGNKFPLDTGAYHFVTKLNLKGSTYIHLLEKLPNVEELRLEITFPDLDETLLRKYLANVILFRVKKLQYFSGCPQTPATIPEQVLKLFITSMPNVESFEAHLTTSLLGLVCRQWTQLRELRIHNLEGNVEHQGLEILGMWNMDRAPGTFIRDELVRMSHLKILNVHRQDEIRHLRYTSNSCYSEPKIGGCWRDHV